MAEAVSASIPVLGGGIFQGEVIGDHHSGLLGSQLAVSLEEQGSAHKLHYSAPKIRLTDKLVSRP